MCLSNSNNSLREDEQQWKGREFGGHGCSAQAWGEESAFFLSIPKSTMGGVCVEAWTDSPATPLPKQLTAITSLSYQ